MDCPVCLDTIIDPLVLQCSHCFCRKCIHRYKQNGGTLCPCCRSPFVLLQLSKEDQILLLKLKFKRFYEHDHQVDISYKSDDFNTYRIVKIINSDREELVSTIIL